MSILKIYGESFSGEGEEIHYHISSEDVAGMFITELIDALKGKTPLDDARKETEEIIAAINPDQEVRKLLADLPKGYPIDPWEKKEE